MRSAPLWIPTLFAFASALEIPFKRASASAVSGSRFLAAQLTAGDEGLGTDDDLIYIANVTISGVDIPVQIDTGSSDLWVRPAQTLSSTTQSTILLNLTYGVGYAAGLVTRADVSFGNQNIPSQAFVLATDASNPIFSYGADGIVGLGFTSLSQIDMSVNETGNSWGRSLLYNAFSQDLSSPNFVSFVLERDEDPSNAQQGSFTIGEYVSQYSAIQNTATLATVPAVNPDRWTIAMDAVETPGNNITSFSSVSASAPSGNAVVLLDSGTSYSYVSTDIAQAIYGNIDGASLDTSSQTWTLPCEAQVSVAFWIGGQRIPIHPLDSNKETSTNTCIGTFLPQSLGVGGSDFDFLLGDVFLRNVYSLYDFGDTDANGQPTSNPYVKLLSITNEDAALVDFVSVRGGTVPASVASATDTGLPAAPSSTSADTLPGVSPASASSSPAVTTGTGSDNILSSVNQILSYIPALLGLLALNLLLLIAFVIAGLVFLLRRRKKGKNQPGGRQTYQPVQLRTEAQDSAFDPGAPYSQDDVELRKRRDSLEPPPVINVDPRQSTFNPRFSLVRPSTGTPERKSSSPENLDGPESPGSASTLVPSTSRESVKRDSVLEPPVLPFDKRNSMLEVPPMSRPQSVVVHSESVDDDLALEPPTRPYDHYRQSFAAAVPLPPSRPQSTMFPQPGGDQQSLLDVPNTPSRPLSMVDYPSARPETVVLPPPSPSPTKRESVLEPPVLPFSTRPSPPTRRAPPAPRPVSHLEVGASMGREQRTLSPGAMENRPRSMFEGSALADNGQGMIGVPILSPPPASFPSRSGGRSPRSRVSPLPGQAQAASQDSAPSGLQVNRQFSSQPQSLANVDNRQSMLSPSASSPSHGARGNSFSTRGSPLARLSYLPGHPDGREDGLQHVDLQNNRATILLPPLPPSPTPSPRGSLHDPSHTPTRIDEDLTDMFSQQQHMRHETGPVVHGNARREDLDDFFHPKAV